MLGRPAAPPAHQPQPVPGASAAGLPHAGDSDKLGKEQAYARQHQYPHPPPPSYHMATTPSLTNSTLSTATHHSAQQLPQRAQQLRRTGRERPVTRDDASSDQDSYWENMEREAMRLEHGARSASAVPMMPVDRDFAQQQQQQQQRGQGGHQQSASYPPYPAYPQEQHDRARERENDYGSASAPPPPSAYRAPPPGSREPQRPLPSPPQSATSHGSGSGASFPPSPSPPQAQGQGQVQVHARQAHQGQGRPPPQAHSPQAPSPTHTHTHTRPAQAPSPTQPRPAPARPPPIPAPSPSQAPGMPHGEPDHPHPHPHPAPPSGPRHLMHPVPSAHHLPPEELERDLPSLPHESESPSAFSGSLGLPEEERERYAHPAHVALGLGREQEGAERERERERYDPLLDEMRLTRGDHGRESSGETVMPGPGQATGLYDGGEYPSELTPLLPGGLRLLRAERDARAEPVEVPRQVGRGEEQEEDEDEDEDGRGGREYERDDGEEDEDEPGMHDLPGERRPLQPPPRAGTPDPLAIDPETPNQPILLPNGNTKLLFRVVNPNRHTVAFKVMTTQPRVYSVRPNFGLILPGATLDLEVHAPQDVASRPRPAAQASRGDRFAVLSRFLTPEEEEELEEREDFAALFPSKTTTAPGVRSQRFRIRPTMRAQAPGQGSAMSATTAGSVMSAFSPSQRNRALSSMGSTGPLSPSFSGAPLPSILGPSTAAAAAAPPQGRPKSPTAIRFAPAVGAVGAMASLAGVAGQFAEAREAERRDEVLRESIGAVQEGVGALKERLEEVLRRMEAENAALKRGKAPDDMPAEMEYSYPQYVTEGRKHPGVHPGRVMALALVVFVATYYGRVLQVI
ncbi:hypothetical protein CALCODRAFT_517504 [Calocera cornea HHB12733]|uniref:MSP domain-containing protein n=1 Tax=Calocera cornea HHB12733 TaxID=1353952 RepID=A0A165FZR9_9BASI|nr:hypothetical protein CALCODRAFT_517504 [Calocera cornea HHB12733]